MKYSDKLFSWFTYEIEPVFLCYFSHQYRISNDFESLERMLEVSIPWAVLLSVSKGVTVAGCG